MCWFIISLVLLMEVTTFSPAIATEQEHGYSNGQPVNADPILQSYNQKQQYAGEKQITIVRRRASGKTENDAGKNEATLVAHDGLLIYSAAEGPPGLIGEPSSHVIKGNVGVVGPPGSIGGHGSEGPKGPPRLATGSLHSDDVYDSTPGVNDEAGTLGAHHSDRLNRNEGLPGPPETYVYDPMTPTNQPQINHHQYQGEAFEYSTNQPQAQPAPGYYREPPANPPNTIVYRRKPSAYPPNPVMYEPDPVVYEGRNPQYQGHISFDPQAPTYHPRGAKYQREAPATELTEPEPMVYHRKPPAYPPYTTTYLRNPAEYPLAPIAVKYESSPSGYNREYQSDANSATYNPDPKTNDPETPTYDPQLATTAYEAYKNKPRYSPYAMYKPMPPIKDGDTEIPTYDPKLPAYKEPANKPVHTVYEPDPPGDDASEEILAEEVEAPFTKPTNYSKYPIPNKEIPEKNTKTYPFPHSTPPKKPAVYAPPMPYEYRPYISRPVSNQFPYTFVIPVNPYIDLNSAPDVNYATSLDEASEGIMIEEPEGNEYYEFLPPYFPSVPYRPEPPPVPYSYPNPKYYFKPPIMNYFQPRPRPLPFYSFPYLIPSFQRPTTVYTPAPSIPVQHRYSPHIWRQMPIATTVPAAPYMMPQASPYIQRPMPFTNTVTAPSFMPQTSPYIQRQMPITTTVTAPSFMPQVSPHIQRPVSSAAAVTTPSTMPQVSAHIQRPVAGATAVSAPSVIPQISHTVPSRNDPKFTHHTYRPEHKEASKKKIKVDKSKLKTNNEVIIISAESSSGHSHHGGNKAKRYTRATTTTYDNYNNDQTGSSNSNNIKKTKHSLWRAYDDIVILRDRKPLYRSRRGGRFKRDII